MPVKLFAASPLNLQAMVVFNWHELLYSFLIYTVLIPIVLGLIQWRLLTQSERWIVAFLVALLVDELLSVLCIALHTRNHFLYHIQTITVLWSVAGVYEPIIGRKHLVWRIALGTSLLMIVEVVFWVGFNHINSVTLAASRLLPAAYALISLNRLFEVKMIRSLTPEPMLYMHLGFFLFGTFTAINAYFMSYFIETSLDLYFLFLTMSALVSATAFGFFSMGFLRIRSANSIQTR